MQLGKGGQLLTFVRLMTLVAVVLSVGCERNAIQDELSASDVAAIRATSERWITGVRAGRWEDVAATFTEDAVLQFPTRRYEGRPAILAWLRTTKPWAASRELHIDEIRGRGDMAFVMGHSTVTPDDGGPPVVVGRYLDIRLRQADGTWLFYRDMVTSVPPPTP
jgi:uncharacterized protein (TIGR02246 family)